MPTTLTPAVAARILKWSGKGKPSDGSTHWSTRTLALRPHRLEGYMASNDPNFETKAAEIIGL